MNFKAPKDCLKIFEKRCERFREIICEEEILNMNYDENQEPVTIDILSIEWKNFVEDVNTYLEIYHNIDNDTQLQRILHSQMITENMITELEGLFHKMRNQLSIEEVKSSAQGNIDSFKESSVPANKKIFIVHGHDNEVKNDVARFLEQQKMEPIILHEQASGGKTIIEKIENYSDAGYAIVLYTPCDQGKAVDESKMHNRARQNVVLEHGFLMGKIGRNKVCALVKGDIEKPGDMDGIVYIVYDDAGGWKMHLAQEMRAAGYSIAL